MRVRAVFSLLVLALLALGLSACNRPASEPVDYGPQLVTLGSGVTAAAAAAAEAADLAQANAAAIASVQASLAVLASSAQALQAVPGQVAALSDTLSRVDPAEVGLLTVYYDLPDTPTVAAGECPADLREATTIRVFLGLSPGPVCVSSSEPAAGVTVHVTPRQMLGVYYHVPAVPDG